MGRKPRSEEIPEVFRNPEELGKGTDWTEQVIEDAVSHNQNITVSGGSENISATVNANITNEGGTIKDTDFNRYSFRSSINASISDRMTVGLKIAPTLSNQDLANTDGVRGRGGVYASTFIANPIVPVRNDQGELIPMIGGPGVLPFPNPVQQATKIKQKRKSSSVLANSFVEFEILRGLKLRSTLGVLRTSETQERYVPSTVGDTFVPPPTVPEASDSEITSTNWSSETTLTYNETFGAHSFELLAGTTIQEDVTDISIFNATDFPDDLVREFEAAQTVNGTTAQQEWSLLSGFGRLIYDYDDKYLLTLSNRADGSSRFGENNRWGVFPSGSAGWRLSDEPFMSGVDWLDNLLLRVGYGLTGNFRIGNYSQFGQVTRTDYVSGQERVAGRSITDLGNPNLTWETVEQLNVGADISLLDGKYRISAEYYRNVSSDMLLNVRTPITSGFRQSLTNRGEVTNRGIELSLNTQLIATDNLSWNVNVNFSRNINKVTELDDQILSTSGAPKHVTREGSPVGMLYG
ncbi:MAG: TonB-dependent receptor domain-containing protein, partial [Halobacteriaceae archaeon]